MSSNKNKSVAQLLLRWGFQMGFQLIPKSSKKEHIEENFQIFDFELTKKEMTFISQLEARPLNRSQLDVPLHLGDTTRSSDPKRRAERLLSAEL